jgi:hypothetical protein
MIEKSRAVGTGELAVELTDEVCTYLVAVIARDLGLLKKFPMLPKKFPEFFDGISPEKLLIKNVPFWAAIEKLVSLEPDAATYFSCLAALHKSRLKYAKILERQPIPTMDQVGPRGLLQFGTMSAKALTAFILWRKWLYDIDNRAAQETGYLFEPIIAHAIGGVPVSAKKSPIRRSQDSTKGRQVDCVRAKRAYEIKMRVTIAASGQGRWGEELSFPVDCRKSGYTPVLVVFDPTENPKLTELKAAFTAQKGEVYVGKAAWKHLDNAAGKTMATFIEKYVRVPIQSMLNELPANGLPEMTLHLDASALNVVVAGERVTISRSEQNPELSDPLELPEDLDEESLGP